MRSQISAVLMIVVALVSARMTLPAPSHAQTPKPDQIVKISYPELDVYDEKGNNLGKPLKTSELSLPLPVRAEAKGLVKIRLADGSFVWIKKSQVTIRSSDAAPPCDPGRKMVAGATRGSGERCR